ncbi:nucleotide exchange factor GrpE [Candidatus Saccharibacteria bacterium RIFCSPHIGHO2_12_FULL_47_16b]|nr:MAG: nucleotide exchange factor GrpE [Candidatus Saccharibacteria bacterium RIFCSPHIGHO2_12_FULL_47_16b]
MKKTTIKELEQKIAELTEALQRERADSINLRRRTDEERSQLANFYKATVVREFLPAIDDLERALNHTPKDLASHNYVKGIQVLAKKFENLLTSLGVKRIKTVGQHFNPHLHEAVHMEDGDGKHEVISEELQAGYKIGDEVVRPAMVKVKRGKK